MQGGNNSSKFLPGNALWIAGEPYSAHSLHMNYTSLKSDLRTYFADRPEQCSMSIAGNRFDLDSKNQQIFQVFFELLVSFSITEPIELGEFDGVVPVQNQA